MEAEKSGREGVTERERKRTSVCERTDVPAKNNHYNLRWWKRPFCWYLSLLVNSCEAGQIILSRKGVPPHPRKKKKQKLLNALFQGSGSCFSSRKSSEVSPKKCLSAF